MKFLHTSDWHLGKTLYDFSLIDDQTHFIEQLLGYLTLNPVDALIIAGDIYDRPIPPASAVQLYDYFLSRTVGELGIPVLAIAGNHDSGSRIAFGSSLYATSGYFVAGSLNSTLQTITLQGKSDSACFTLIPYLHPAEVRALYPAESVRTFDDAYRILLAAHSTTLDFDLPHIAVAHGFFGKLTADGAQNELLTSDSEINVGGVDIADCSCFSPFTYAALGHLHAPQKLGQAVRYSGSPLKYSLSEQTQRKSLSLVQLDANRTVSVEPICFTPLRDLRTIQGTLQQLLEPSFHSSCEFDDYVFAEIAGQESLYPMQKLRTLFPYLLGLRFSAQDLGQLNISAMQGHMIAGVSGEELFCRFFRQAKGYDLPQEQLMLLREALSEATGYGEVSQ